MQTTQVRVSKLGVVREAFEPDELAACRSQRPLDFPGLSHARKGQAAPGGARGCPPGRSPHGARREQATQFGRTRKLSQRAKKQDRIGARHAGGQVLAERSGRQRPSRTERPLFIAGLRVHHDQGERLFERRILVTVVHDDGVESRLRDGASSPRAIARDEGGELAREHHGLVAHLRRRLTWLDPNRTSNRAAVPRREDRRPPPRFREQARDFHHHRRLARSANGQVADADHGHTAALERSLHKPARRCLGPDRAEGREQRRKHLRGRVPPIPPARRSQSHLSRRSNARSMAWTAAESRSFTKMRANSAILFRLSGWLQRRPISSARQSGSTILTAPARSMSS